jgi:hypothetical protein
LTRTPSDPSRLTSSSAPQTEQYVAAPTRRIAATGSWSTRASSSNPAKLLAFAFTTPGLTPTRAAPSELRHTTLSPTPPLDRHLRLSTAAHTAFPVDRLNRCSEVPLFGASV